MQTGDLLTPEDVAELLGGHVTPRTVQVWCKTKKLPAIRAGRRWLVRRADLASFLQHGPGEGAAESNSLAA